MKFAVVIGGVRDDGGQIASHALPSKHHGTRSDDGN
jgi:hypothetical protein